jgi:hypothetical protein
MCGSHTSFTENSSLLVCDAASLDHSALTKTHHNIPEDLHLQHMVFLEQLIGIQMIKKPLLLPNVNVHHSVHKSPSMGFLFSYLNAIYL